MPVTRSQARQKVDESMQSLTELKTRTRRKLAGVLKLLDLEGEKREKQFKSQFNVFKKSITPLLGLRVFCEDGGGGGGGGTEPLKQLNKMDIFAPLQDGVIKRPANNIFSEQFIETSLRNCDSSVYRFASKKNNSGLATPVRVLASISAQSHKIAHRQSRLDQTKTPITPKSKLRNAFVTKTSQLFSSKRKQKCTQVVFEEKIIYNKKDNRIWKCNEPAGVFSKTKSGGFIFATNSNEYNELINTASIADGAAEHLNALLK